MPMQTLTTLSPVSLAAGAAMLRLRRSVLAHLLSSPLASPVSHHRLISAAAPAVSPDPSSFAVEEYLVEICCLTPAQALKASPKLSHLKSPVKPDSVLTFLAGLGLSGADVASVVAKDPQLLCTSVERILAPNAAALTGAGLSRSDIARLLSLGRTQFRCRAIVSNLQYYLHLFGSFDNLFPALRAGLCLNSADLETVVKPNVGFLRECGLADYDIAKLCIYRPWLLASNVERVRAMVALSEGIGVPCGSRMFKHALHAVVGLSKEKIAVKVDYLKKTFRWSDAEACIALSKVPIVLTKSNQMLQSKSDFLISGVGLEPAYIAHRPVMLGYSLQGRLRTRYYVVKYLKENGFIDHDRNYYSTLSISEKVFMEKFICPHREAAPHLAEDYADACKGEVPTRFRFA